MPKWKDLINTRQAATILGCSRANVARMCREGKLAAKDIGHGCGDTFARWVIDRRDVLNLKEGRERI
jgi:hypothetical protein